MSPALAPETPNVIVPVPPTLGGNVGPPRVEVVVLDVLVLVLLLLVLLLVVLLLLVLLVLVLLLLVLLLLVLLVVDSVVLVVDSVVLVVDSVVLVVDSVVLVVGSVVLVEVVGVGTTQVASLGGRFTLNTREPLFVRVPVGNATL